MPATGRGILQADCVPGVDGYRAGWIFEKRFPLTGEMHVAIADSCASIPDGLRRNAEGWERKSG